MDHNHGSVEDKNQFIRIIEHLIWLLLLRSIDRKTIKVLWKYSPLGAINPLYIIFQPFYSSN